MHTIMSLEQLNTMADVALFLAGTQAVAISLATTKQAHYQWVQKTLVKHQYLLLSKADRGVITRYLTKVTAYSRAQIKRLIQQYDKTGSVKVKLGFRRKFLICWVKQQSGIRPTQLKRRTVLSVSDHRSDSFSFVPF
jgi:hypothetical protein